MVQTFTLANISDIWAFAAGGLQITATQDVTGVTVASQSQATTLPCTVVALQGQSITSTAPTSNQALVWNSGTSKWTPTAIVNSFNTRTGAVTLTAADISAVLAIGATLTFSGNTLETAALTGDVTAAANSFATTVAKIQGTTVSGTTGSGNVVFSASPTFTGTVNISTLSLTNALTLPNGSLATTQTAGDNSTKVATTAYADANFVRLTLTGQSFTGGVRTPSANLATGNVTLDPGNGQMQNITNGGAFTITAPSHDGAIVLDIVNNASAGAITWTGFTSEANHGDPLDTTNGHKFRVSITTNNSVSTYIIHALQ